MIFLVPVTCKKVRLSFKHTGRFLSVYFQQCLTIYGPIKSESKFSFHPPIYIHSDPFCLKKNVMRWEVCSTTKLTLGKKEIEQNRLHRFPLSTCLFACLFLRLSVYVLPTFFLSFPSDSITAKLAFAFNHLSFKSLSFTFTVIHYLIMQIACPES